ncbi:MAG: HAMP domain-containing sensor histidine kinase, partial [Novosphingobium sp.]
MPRPVRLFDSAAYRIAFACAGAFALANVLLGMFVYVAAHRAIVAQVEGQIVEESKSLLAEYREGGLRELHYAIHEREDGVSANGLVYAVYSPQGRQIDGAMRTGKPPKPGWSNIRFADPVEGPDPARALTVLLPDGSRLVVAADKQKVERIDDIIVSLFALALLLILLFGASAALLIGRYLQRRLAGVANAADAIVAGRMHERIPVGPRNDEFDRLAATLNAMLDRIADLMTNLRQVSSDVAHDLRTPLAQLRQQLEHSLARPQDAPAQRAVLEDACERIDEVLGLFAAILRISALEGSPRRAFAPMALEPFVTDLCEIYAPAVEDGGRSLTWLLDSGCEIEGDRELLAQALINLLDNAQIHTPPGTAIGVTLTRDGDECRLTVSDNGPGVPEADRARIAQRFTRLETSRSTPGHGLGLSLVQAIVRVHGGRMETGG